MAGAADADDHQLHKQAVSLAGRPQDGGKFIQKALDRRHEVAIKQCARIKDESGLLAYWEEALKRGDIPGLIKDLIGDDCTWISPGPTDKLPWAGTFKGKQGVGNFFTQVGQLCGRPVMP